MKGRKIKEFKKREKIDNWLEKSSLDKMIPIELEKETGLKKEDINDADVEYILSFHRYKELQKKYEITKVLTDEEYLEMGIQVGRIQAFNESTGAIKNLEIKMSNMMNQKGGKMEQQTDKMSLKNLGEVGVTQGYIQIQPTMEQFEVLKEMKQSGEEITQELMLNEFPLNERIETIVSNNRKEFNTMKIKLNYRDKNTGDYTNDGIIQVIGDDKINKILYYANEKTPVKITSEINIGKDEKRYYKAFSIEDMDFEKFQQQEQKMEISSDDIKDIVQGTKNHISADELERIENNIDINYKKTGNKKEKEINTQEIEI